MAKLKLMHHPATDSRGIPADVPLCHQNRANRDSKNRFYEDIFRVIIQNERPATDERKRALMQLKVEFKTFRTEVANYLQDRYRLPNNGSLPKMRISSAFEGNILETLNVSMNLYARYNLDRNFDRSGKAVVIITPGNGFFQSDSQLFHLTKRRTVDLGVGIDLICLGIQPLHGVPMVELIDSSSEHHVIPYWINCSFYRSAHEMLHIKLGHPIDRIQTIPVVDRKIASNLPNWTDESKTREDKANTHSTPVYRLAYPPCPIDASTSQLISLESPHLLTSPLTSIESTSGTALARTPYRIDTSLCTPLTSISMSALHTVHAVSRAGHQRRANAITRLHHASESDTSPMGSFEGDRELRIGGGGGNRRGNGAYRSQARSMVTQRMTRGGGGGAVPRVGTSTNIIINSLPSVREHQTAAAMGIRKSHDNNQWSNYQRHPSLVHDDVAQQRGSQTESMSSDGATSTAGSMESGKQTNSLAPPRRTGERPFNSRSNVRTSSQRQDSFYVAFGSDVYNNNTAPSPYTSQTTTSANTLPSSRSHTTAITPFVPVSINRRISTSQSTTYTTTHRTQASTTSHRARQSTLQPPWHLPNNPFLSMEQSSSSLSVGRRRWIGTRPLRESLGASTIAVSPPLVMCYAAIPHPPPTPSPTLTDRRGIPAILLDTPLWDLAVAFKPAGRNLSEVWDAYFAFHQEQRNHSAPGGPIPKAIESGMIGSGTVSMPLFDGVHRTTAFIDHTTTMRQSGWNELPSSFAHSRLAEAGASSSTVQRLLDKIDKVSKQLASGPPKLGTLTSAQSAMLNNALQLIDVDWKSLSTPALLPSCTDFFPNSTSLNREGYTLQDYRVVPVGTSIAEWESTHNFEREPGLFYSRRQLTAREVFCELLLQRLSHGFQLFEEMPVTTPATVTLGSSSESVVSPCSSQTSTINSTTGLNLSEGGSRLSVTAYKPNSQRASYPSPQPHLDRRPVGRSTLMGTSAETTSSGRRLTRTGGSGTYLSSRSARSRPTPRGVISTAVVSTGQTTGLSRSQISSTTTVRSIGLGVTRVASASAMQVTSKPSVTIRSNRPGVRSSNAPATQSIVDRLFPAEKTSFKLSLGNLFHSVTLDEDSITLTSYRSCNAEKPTRIEYKYALHVPDSLTYHPLRTVFTNDAASMLNWSYCDNYLRTRGVNESYTLVPSMKYWRSRFMLLPIFTTETRRLADAVKEKAIPGEVTRIACDKHETDYRSMDLMKISDRFLHFLESINRVRRPPILTRKLVRQSTTDKTDVIQRTRDLHNMTAPSSSLTDVSLPVRTKSASVATTSLSTVTSTLAALSQHRLSANPSPVLLLPNTDSTAESTSGLDETSSGQTSMTGGSSTSDIPGTGVGVASSSQGGGCVGATHVTSVMHSIHTPAWQVVNGMSHQDHGLPFLQMAGTTVFPERTFLAFDAVVWIIKTLSDIGTVEQAVAYLQTLVNTGWIRHTSGNPAHRFIYGSYFYTLLVSSSNPSSIPVTSLSDASDLSVQSTPVTPSPSGVGDDSYHLPVDAVRESFFNTNIGKLMTHIAAINSMNATQSATNLQVSATNTATLQPKLSDFGESPHPSPAPFPEVFLPQTNSDSTNWTPDFQTDWVEVAFAQTHNSSDSHTPVKAAGSPLDGVNDGIDEEINDVPGDYLTLANMSHWCGMSERVGYNEVDTVLRKTCLCDIDDVNATEGRTEWAHCVYDANYHPRFGFTIEVQWMVASGARLTELITNWDLRSSTNEFHFFPVPCDPFGQPGVRSDTDPLRIPIFVPMNLTALLRDIRETHSFKSGSTVTVSTLDPLVVQHSPMPATNSAASSVRTTCEETHTTTETELAVEMAARLFPTYAPHQQVHLLRSFQDYLLRSFGFLSSTYDTRYLVASDPQKAANSSPRQMQRQWNFVHCSGGMFIRIPIYCSRPVECEVQMTPTEEESPESMVATMTGGGGGGTMAAAAASGGGDSSSFASSIDSTVATLQMSNNISPGTSDQWIAKPDCATPTLQVRQTRLQSWIKEGSIMDPTECNNACFEDRLEPGYFWAWNHMRPKHWRYYLAGDESYQDAMLADFRAFLNAEDKRMLHSFQSFMNSIQNPETNQ